ncbi:hypothetical protein CFD26_103415 [Aspergillus turcosus]|uniref:Cellulase n=1 Tax=Aspergillus turcosus TaxID=1245748 RepID=A0A3R7F2A5_9EURO|nr:hypothetical protein CFD26_103415 [Aspergillus turcosus]
MRAQTILACLGLVASASAYLATTTRYYDGQEGACGCGTSSGAYSWQLGISNGVYTAAGSQALFDTAGASWCGAGCGKCYNLTSTGNSPCSGCGTGGVAGESIIVMVTNLCPYNGNQQWCPQVGGTNQYGYSYHFDIMAQSEVFGDNVVVNFEPVACPGQATSDWETCVCYGKTAADVTPVGLTTGGSNPSPPTLTTTTTTGGATQTLYGQCGGSGWTGPTACASGATCLIGVAVSTAKPTVYLIRHGEKPSDGGNGLSAQGLERAQCLRTVFGASSSYNIGYIMAQTPKSDGKRARPYETVEPLAEDLGLTVDTSCDRDDPKCVRDVVEGYTGSGNILICWEHDALTDIVEELGDDDAPSYPDDRFDLIWTDSYPYSEITAQTSEQCPGLDD